MSVSGTRPGSKGESRSRRLIQAEDLRRFISVTDPRISPDGTAVLFTHKQCDDRNQDVANLWLIESRGGNPIPFTNGGKDGHGRWSPDGEKIAFISGREKHKPKIFLLRRGGGEAFPLTCLPEGRIADFKWSPDGRWIAFRFRPQEPDFSEESRKRREEKGESVPPRVIDQLWYRLDGDGYFNGQRFHLYLLEVATGKHRLLFDKAPLGISAFSWAPDSRSIAITANLDPAPMLHPWKSRIYLLDISTGRHRPVPHQKDGDRGPLSWSPDGRTIAFGGQMGRESLWGCKNQRLFTVDPETGKQTDLTGDQDYCLCAPLASDIGEISFSPRFRWHPSGSWLVAEVGWQGSMRIVRVPAKGGQWEFLTPPDRNFFIGNFTRNGGKLALLSSSELELGEVFIGDLARGGGRISTSRLTRLNQELLSELVLSRPESHWVDSSDGTRVQLWIMRPPTAKAGNRCPAVLEIHGGPHAQYGRAFFHEFQLLAARGYVVCFSNPRGSKGYGEDFCQAIRGDWGNHDWTDLQAVIGFLEKRPFVDPHRMGVMGGSYGGYMTNWVIGQTDRFKAAITDRCVSNLVSMLGSSDFPTLPDTYWKGNCWDRPEDIWLQSPLRFFGQVKTPTLIIHSEGDLRCNIEQAEQIFTALQIRGIPSRFVRYPPGTSHGMSRAGPADLRIHRLNQILDWWRKYLGK